MSQSQTLKYLDENSEAQFRCPNCNEKKWKDDWISIRQAAMVTFHRAAAAGSEGAAGGGEAAGAEAQG